MKRRLAALRAALCRNSGQCSVCSGWFDNWPGGTCDACQATGRR
jgi:hypothetical protein